MIISSLEDISGRYRAILCDVWGVLHNGVSAFPGAVAALRAARERGIAVVLITNSPRLRGEVEAQLRIHGVPDDAWDRIVTSGDVSRELVGTVSRNVFHIGQDRDLSFYDGIDVELVAEEGARSVVCTALFDDADRPETYAPMLVRLRDRDLPFICVNPDIVVERGNDTIWCAGSLARLYEQLGGCVLFAGKPHRPIYKASLKAAADVIAREVAVTDVLAIGDGVHTDVNGAVHNGMDVLFVSGGIHAREYGPAENPDEGLLRAFFERHNVEPVAAIPRLR